MGIETLITAVFGVGVAAPPNDPISFGRYAADVLFIWNNRHNEPFLENLLSFYHGFLHYLHRRESPEAFVQIIGRRLALLTQHQATLSMPELDLPPLTLQDLDESWESTSAMADLETNYFTEQVPLFHPLASTAAFLDARVHRLNEILTATTRGPEASGYTFTPVLTPTTEQPPPSYLYGDQNWQTGRVYISLLKHLIGSAKPRDKLYNLVVSTVYEGLQHLQFPIPDTIQIPVQYLYHGSFQRFLSADAHEYSELTLDVLAYLQEELVAMRREASEEAGQNPGFNPFIARLLSTELGQFAFQVQVELDSLHAAAETRLEDQARQAVRGEEHNFKRARAAYLAWRESLQYLLSRPDDSEATGWQIRWTAWHLLESSNDLRRYAGLPIPNLEDSAHLQVAPLPAAHTPLFEVNRWADAISIYASSLASRSVLGETIHNDEDLTLLRWIRALEAATERAGLSLSEMGTPQQDGPNELLFQNKSIGKALGTLELLREKVPTPSPSAVVASEVLRDEYNGRTLRAGLLYGIIPEAELVEGLRGGLVPARRVPSQRAERDGRALALRLMIAEYANHLRSTIDSYFRALLVRELIATILDMQRLLGFEFVGSPSPTAPVRATVPKNHEVAEAHGDFPDPRFAGAFNFEIEEHRRRLTDRQDLLALLRFETDPDALRLLLNAERALLKRLGDINAEILAIEGDEPDEAQIQEITGGLNTHQLSVYVQVVVMRIHYLQERLEALATQEAAAVVRAAQGAQVPPEAAFLGYLYPPIDVVQALERAVYQEVIKSHEGQDAFADLLDFLDQRKGGEGPEGPGGEGQEDGGSGEEETGGISGLAATPYNFALALYPFIAQRLRDAPSMEEWREYLREQGAPLARDLGAAMGDLSRQLPTFLEAHGVEVPESVVDAALLGALATYEGRSPGQDPTSFQAVQNQAVPGANVANTAATSPAQVRAPVTLNH